MIDLTQEQVEKNLSDVLPHGIRTAIAKGTGIHDKIVAAYFNPHDERKSPHFEVLQMQAVIDELDPATGEALWQAMSAMRDQSRPVIADHSVEHEMGVLSKEITDVIVARCEGHPTSVQLREIAEAEQQIARYKATVIKASRPRQVA